MTHEGVPGTHFAVWAPNARRVSVVGDFNAWDGRRHPMAPARHHGRMGLFLPAISEGAVYKSRDPGPRRRGPAAEGRPRGLRLAARARERLGRAADRRLWLVDRGWMETRADRNARTAPISIYEVHLASWRRRDDGRPISYVEAARELVDYVWEMGFTHIELLRSPNIPSTRHGATSRWAFSRPPIRQRSPARVP